MKMTLTWILTFALLFIQVSTAEQLGDLPVDQTSTQAIKAATTDPMFLTDWVSKIPDHSTIPSPRDFLGYVIGTPGELTQVEQIHGYFHELEKTSIHIRIFSLGNTHGGRDMLLAAIADGSISGGIRDYRSEAAACEGQLPYLPDLMAPAVPEEAHVIMYTSGTTGQPKGAVLSHRKTFFNCLNADVFFKLHFDDIMLVVLPLFHSGGLFIQTSPVIYKGATMILHKSFDPHRTYRDIQNY